MWREYTNDLPESVKGEVRITPAIQTRQEEDKERKTPAESNLVKSNISQGRQTTTKANARRVEKLQWFEIPTDDDDRETPGIVSERATAGEKGKTPLDTAGRRRKEHRKHEQDNPWNCGS